MIAASGHILYEIDTLYSTASLWKALSTKLQYDHNAGLTTATMTCSCSSPYAIGGKEDNSDKIIMNALIESYGIHLRTLYEFLGQFNEKKNSKNKSDDILVKHFIKDNQILKKLKAAVRNLKRVHEFINKSVAHLTYKRIEYKKLNQALPIIESMNELINPIKIFVENAEHLVRKNDILALLAKMKAL